MSKFRSLVDCLRSIPSAGKRNTIFAFCSEGSSPPHELFAKNPTAALTLLKNHLAGGVNAVHPEDFDACADAVLSGGYCLVEFHLFTRHEHILVKSKPDRSLSMARRQPRYQDAFRALSTSINGYPPIDYEGLPKDEDL